MSAFVWEMIIGGDAEAAVRDILANLTPELPIGGAHPPLNITTNLINYDPGERWIEITQEGATDGFVKIQHVRVDVAVLAERRSVAKDIAEIALASIHRWKGNYTGFGLRICDVATEMGITRVPDKLQETSRYIFSVRLTVVPYGSPNMVPAS